MWVWGPLKIPVCVIWGLSLISINFWIALLSNVTLDFTMSTGVNDGFQCGQGTGWKFVMNIWTLTIKTRVLLPRLYSSWQVCLPYLIYLEKKLFKFKIFAGTLFGASFFIIEDCIEEAQGIQVSQQKSFELPNFQHRGRLPCLGPIPIFSQPDFFMKIMLQFIPSSCWFLGVFSEVKNKLKFCCPQLHMLAQSRVPIISNIPPPWIMNRLAN